LVNVENLKICNFASKPAAFYKEIYQKFLSIWSSFICQGTSTRRQRSDICGLRVKLPPVSPLKCWTSSREAV